MLENASNIWKPINRLQLAIFLLTTKGLFTPSLTDKLVVNETKKCINRFTCPVKSFII